MISDVCKIENGTSDLSAILKESEKVARYNAFTHKQSLQLRLICEEIDGMLPNIIDDFNGDFWVEYEDGTCKVNVSIVIPELTAGKKSDLINVATNKKNAAAVGIVGKIRNALENAFLSETTALALNSSFGSFGFSTGCYDGMDYSYLWTLNDYRAATQQEQETEAWDELEKSIIANLADDIIVGVKGKQANVVIVKKFK